MNESFDSDDMLMAELALLAAEFDPVPADVVASARASYVAGSAWDAALAELIFDSSSDRDDTRALTVRASAGARELTFQGPELTIEMEVGPVQPQKKDHYRIMGQLVPASSASIEVRRPDSSFFVDADPFGRFAIETTSPGPISIRCTPEGTAPTSTEWFLI